MGTKTTTKTTMTTSIAIQTNCLLCHKAHSHYLCHAGWLADWLAGSWMGSFFSFLQTLISSRAWSPSSLSSSSSPSTHVDRHHLRAGHTHTVATTTPTNGYVKKKQQKYWTLYFVERESLLMCHCLWTGWMRLWLNACVVASGMADWASEWVRYLCKLKFSVWVYERTFKAIARNFTWQMCVRLKVPVQKSYKLRGGREKLSRRFCLVFAGVATCWNFNLNVLVPPLSRFTSK